MDRRFSSAVVLLVALFIAAALSASVAGASDPLCGNGLIDRPQESCDPNASEYYGVEHDGCEAGQICKDCKCLKPVKVLRPKRSASPAAVDVRRPVAVQENLCGNGRVDAGEQCDPKANPAGCPEDRICTDVCTCVFRINPVRQLTPVGR